MDQGDQVSKRPFLVRLAAHRDGHIDFIDVLGSAEIEKVLGSERRFKHRRTLPDPQAMNWGGARLRRCGSRKCDQTNCADDPCRSDAAKRIESRDYRVHCRSKIPQEALYPQTSISRYGDISEVELGL